ncbi:MAG: iron ABC transporter permease, partial [Candidatus Rokubacteria bacterium]|nr:iron ABC transporter permease [Candidatus Rokubacteria bacterium]
MTAVATARSSAPWRRLAGDPALLAAVAAIWCLLLLFVLYPLVHLLERAFVDEGMLTLEPLLSAVTDPSHQAAFLNSLVLAGSVGLLGTALGLVFALTAVRSGLGRHWLTLLDAAALLPLVSPPFTTSISIIFSFGPGGLITHDLLGLTNVSAYGF